MRRPLGMRLGSALAAVAFAATSSVTDMEAHPLSAHGLHGGATLAPDVARAPDRAAQAHAGHFGPGHQGHGAEGAAGGGAPTRDAEPPSRGGRAADPAPASHSEHSSDNCPCVGPCHGGPAPTLSAPTAAEVARVEADPEPVVPVPERLVHRDPTSYLLPLANAPPARV